MPNYLCRPTELGNSSSPVLPEGAHGYVNSVDWNGGMERWIGLLEWSTGLDYWSATPTNAQFGLATNLIFKLYKAGRGSMTGQAT